MRIRLSPLLYYNVSIPQQHEESCHYDWHPNALFLAFSFCHACKADLGKGDVLKFRISNLFHYLCENAQLKICREKYKHEVVLSLWYKPQICQAQTRFLAK